MAPVSPLTSVRALFHCFATEESQDGKSQTVRLRPAYAEENKSFAAATPWGDMTMGISNPDAIGFFETGKSYFLDFTPQVESSLERAAAILKEEPAPEVPLAPEVAVDDLLTDPAPADDKVSLPVAEEPAAEEVGGGAPVAAVASAAAGVAVANPETEQAAVVTATEQPAEASIEPEPVEDTPEEKAAKDAAAAAVKTAGDA